jgi:hypothetical protein
MLWFWKPDQQAELFAHKLPDNVRDMALSADSKRIAVAFQGGAIRVYPISA